MTLVVRSLSWITLGRLPLRLGRGQMSVLMPLPGVLRMYLLRRENHQASIEHQGN